MRIEKAPFPLTLTLSPRERETVIPSGRKSQRVRTLATPSHGRKAGRLTFSATFWAFSFRTE